MTMASEDTECTFPDFSTLPDVVWVRVLQYLPLVDRANVGYTCRALFQAFNHPTLWSTQSFLFLGQEHNFDRKSLPVTAARGYVELTEHFGQYFQNLAIKVSGHFTGLPENLKLVLEQVTEKCRLESLTLDIGKMTSRFHTKYGFPPDSSAMEILASFVRNAYRMKRLHIRSWPMFDKHLVRNECNVFKSMVSNQKLVKNLETLTLFWLEGCEWTEREPLLLDPEETMTIIDHFKNLQCIGLRTPMIQMELVEMLASASRRKLETLKILVHFLDPQRKPKFRIPIVPSRIWQSLVNRNPDFRVEVAVCLNTPDIELSNILTPEVPVSVFRYMKYSRIDPMTLHKLTSLYAGTLTAFHSFCESDDVDQALMLLARQCPNLREIIYHGNIYCDTVTALAEIKGDQWKVFEMKSRNIKIRTEFDDVDEDEVLRRNAEGNLQQVALLRFHADDESQLEKMAADVSKALGRPWLPTKTNT